MEGPSSGACKLLTRQGDNFIFDFGDRLRRYEVIAFPASPPSRQYVQAWHRFPRHWIYPATGRARVPAVDGPLDRVPQTAPEMAQRSGAGVCFSAAFGAEEIQQTSHAPYVDQSAVLVQDCIWL